MVSVIFSLAILLLCSMGLGLLFNRRTEECVPMLMMGIAAALFFFYCANLLRAGICLLYAVLLIVLGFSVRKIRQLRKNGLSGKDLLFQKLLSPGVAVFLFLSILFLIFAAGRMPAVWDELRLWAAMPKALHAAGQLQVGEGALLYSTMQSYPPGLSLLVAFMTALQGSWDYGSVYAVYWIFYAALFLPAFRHWKYNKWHYLAPAAFLVVGGALFLTMSGNEPSGDYAFFFGSLYVDPYLGCMLGSGLFRLVKDPFADGFSLTGFSLTLFLLSMMKNVGALYAGVLFAAALILFFWKRKKGPARKTLWLLLPLTFTALPYGLWQWIIRTRGTGEFIDFHYAGFTAEKAGNVLLGLASWGVIPFLYFALFYLLCAFVMQRVLKDIEKRKALLAAGALALCFLLFLYGYISHYGLMLSSIHRYTSTFTFACFVYLFCRLLDHEGKKVPEAGGKEALLSVLFLFAAVFLLAYNQPNYYPNKSAEEARALCEEARLKADPSYSAKRPAKTCLVIGGDTRKRAQLHESCALSLIGSPLNIQSIWCDKLYNEAEYGLVTDPKEQTRIFAETLAAQHYEYVIVLHPDADIRYALKQLSPQAPADGTFTIYRVQNSGPESGPSLQRIS